MWCGDALWLKLKEDSLFFFSVYLASVISMNTHPVHHVLYNTIQAQYWFLSSSLAPWNTTSITIVPPFAHSPTTLVSEIRTTTATIPNNNSYRCPLNITFLYCFKICCLQLAPDHIIFLASSYRFSPLASLWNKVLVHPVFPLALHPTMTLLSLYIFVVAVAGPLHRLLVIA